MSQPSPPSAPNASKEYKQGIEIYLKYLPKMLRQEQQFRELYDPKRIEEQQMLQALYGPTQYNQQLQALRQLDPMGYAMRNQLGAEIRRALSRGAVDPRQAEAYRMLGQSVTGNLARGTQLDPAFQRQLQQSIRAGQSARGNIMGNAPISAEALYQGQRAQQLLQQRQGATQAFLGLQNPRERALAEAGSFLSLRDPISQIAGITSVAPDRASAYVNPNAGYMGQQWGLQNYANQLGAYQAGGGATNPWMNALSGAASGAAAGTMYNFPYGTAIGAIGGGLTGYFSDERLKKNIIDTGERTKDGVPIVTFEWVQGVLGRWKGVIAQTVLKYRPDAVFPYHGYLMVDYAALGVECMEVK
jgi:hypothetical protein